MSANLLDQLQLSPCGGIGRHTGLKILRRLRRASSSLAGGTKYWDIAQLVEQVTVNHPVAGSSPAIPAKHTTKLKVIRC